ncbi:universal stress protein [Thermodesulfobacteriota bacterium]
MKATPETSDPNKQDDSLHHADATALPKKGKEKKKNYSDITALIRSVQRAEDNVACFRTGRAVCDRMDCLWREYCLKDQQVSCQKTGSSFPPKTSLPLRQKRVSLKSIICTTDFSDLSNQAVRYGTALAAEFDAKLYVCHVIDLPAAALPTEIHRYPHEEQNARMKSAFKQLEKLLGKDRIDWEPLIGAGNPVDEICRLAEVMDADLVISATRGRSGLRRLILGSVTEHLIRMLPCPLLIVRQSVPNFDSPSNRFFGFQRILVGFDFSYDSSLAFQYGLSLSQEFQAELHLAHVVEPPVYRDLQKIARERDNDHQRELRRFLSMELSKMVPEETSNACNLRTTLLDGQPFKELTRYAELQNMDLIILGVRGRSLIETFGLGSTTDRVVRQAPCPVLSVLPTTSNSIP